LFGTFIPPLGGVIIGDYFFTYKKNLPMLDYVKFRKLRIAPLIAYLVGCGAAYFGGVFEVGVPSLQGIIIAALAVPVANMLLKSMKVDDMHEVLEDAKYV
jgi:cytosine permease